MEQRRWAVVVAALVLCAGAMAACAPAAAEEPSSVATSVSTLAARGEGAEPPQLARTPEVDAPQGAPDEAADRFASALVSGDLTAVTLSFAPSGLAGARALVDQTGARGIGHFEAASVETLVVSDDAAQWEIVFALSSVRGESRLWTQWRWFPDAGWRITAVRLQS